MRAFALMGLAGRARIIAAALMAVAMLGASPLLAQEIAPDHLALARKYVDLTDRSAIYEVTLVQAGIQTMRVILQQNPELREQVDGSIEEVLAEYRGRKGELLDQFARIYAQRFTPEELQQIVTFYESPVGVKLATANSEINRELQAVMQVFEANLSQEFFAKVRSSLRDKGVEL